VSVPVWVADLAAGFWAAAGDPPPFPRDLREPARWAFPFAVVEVHGLSVAGVFRWLADRDIPVPVDEPDRPLRACLYARSDRGFAFVEAADDPAERRFSVAHELAHFLRDYWRPRRAAERQLGRAVLEVLDGLRPPTADERLAAVLRNRPIGPHVHLLRRDGCGRPPTAAEREAEAAADRLAFELLAPAAAVEGPGGRPGLVGRLVGEFGLPPAPAGRYAAILVPEAAAAGGLVARLLGR
jgi:hypothetical protein